MDADIVCGYILIAVGNGFRDVYKVYNIFTPKLLPFTKTKSYNLPFHKSNKYINLFSLICFSINYIDFTSNMEEVRIIVITGYMPGIKRPLITI